MAVIKHAMADEIAREAIVLDLGDLEQHAAVLRERAEREAARIVAEARAERERLITDAAEVGRAQGYEEGKKAGYDDGIAQGRDDAIEHGRAEIAARAAAWQAAVEGFSAERAAVVAEARRDVLRLAVAIAEKLTHRVFELDAQQVVRSLEAAIGLVTEPTKLTVRAHPDDAAVVREILPRFVQAFERSPDVELDENDSIPRGSCVVRTGKGMIDATLDTQLDRVVEALLGDDPTFVADVARMNDDADAEPTDDERQSASPGGDSLRSREIDAVSEQDNSIDDEGQAEDSA